MRRPEFIARQAACPTGLLGRLLGRIMAAETADANRAAVVLLDLQPTDQVLEVGCGHGATIALMAATVTGGYVAGVDISEEMQRQAARRNRAAMLRGAVELRQAAAEQLPYPTERFDKALSVHTLYFWREPNRALAEIRRVLKPGGRVVLAWRHDPKAFHSFPEAVYRFHDAASVRGLLRSAGFGDARIVERVIGGAVLYLAVAQVDSDRTVVLELGHEALIGPGRDEGAALGLTALREEVPVSGLSRVPVVRRSREQTSFRPAAIEALSFGPNSGRS